MSLLGRVVQRDNVKWCVDCGCEFIRIKVETCPVCLSGRLVSYREEDTDDAR